MPGIYTYHTRGPQAAGGASPLSRKTTFHLYEEIAVQRDSTFHCLMSDTWGNISLKEFKLLAAEKNSAATTAKVSSSIEGPAAGSAAGDKRGSSSQTLMVPAVTRQRHSARNSTSPEGTPTPAPSDGDSQAQQPESAGGAPAPSTSVAAANAVEFDPAAAGTIPSNLLFGIINSTKLLQ